MKKLISVLLVLVLLISSMPFFSVAETDVTEEPAAVLDIGEENDLPEDGESLEPGTVLLLTEDPEDDDPEEPVVEEPVVEEPVVEEPVVEEPVVEEPVVEEPVVEEPVVEEPVVEEPVAEEPAAEKPVVEEPVVEEPVAEEPVVEEPVAEKPVVEEPVVEKPVVEEPEAEKPVAEKPVVEEPVTEKPVVEEPARFEQGYVQVKKDTVVYAEANKKEETGTFAEDAIVYAKLDTQRDDPAKDWLKINFAVEIDGQKTVETGYIQAESMKALSEAEIAQLTAKLDLDALAPEYNGHKLLVVNFVKTPEEAAVEAVTVEEPAAEQPAAEEPATKQPIEPKVPVHVEPTIKEGEDGEVGDNKSALPTVKLSAYSCDGYMIGKVAVSNASGTVEYYWYALDGDGNYTYLGDGKSIKISANDYIGSKLLCSVHVNGLYIDTSSVTIVNTPYVNPRYQNTTIGETSYFTCYNVPDGATVSYQWQYSKDGGKTWKNSSLSTKNKQTLAVPVTEKNIQLLFRCAAKINGTNAYTNSVYMIAAVAPSTVSGKINTYVKISAKCENATGDVSYYWQLSEDNGMTWQDSTASGCNTSTVKFKLTNAATKRLYRCIVYSNVSGSVISNSVKVKGIFTVAATPTRKAVHIGKTVNFTAKTYFAPGSVSYQWQYSADKGKTWKNSTITGNKTKTLKVKMTESRLGVRFRCKVTSGGKTLYTNAVLPYCAIATPKTVKAKVGDTVKFTAKVYNTNGTVKYQWQYSRDEGKTWINSTATGNKSKTLSVKISKAAYLKYYFRCRVTDKTGTVNTDPVHPIGNLAISISRGNTGVAIGKTAKFKTSVEFASGSLKYTWQYSKDNGKTWKDSTALSGANASMKVSEKYLTYLFRCKVKDKTGTATSNSIRLIDFTLASTKPKYRALLIGERAFTPYCARNGGDVVHMASMLGKVRGPGGAKYSVTQKFDLTWSEIKSAIQTTFAGTKDTDVSLFMIASHGAVDPASGVSAGAVATMSYSLYFSELADWFNTYCKGKVIVIIETCGSGSAIYDPSVSQNGMILANAADEKLVQSAVSAFASADPGITMETTEIAENGDGEISVNTGELRTSKYYVLAAARHQEYSYGQRETGSASTQDQSGNVFIYGLVQGIGSSSSSPADKSPKNRVITLEEAYSYCKSYARSWSQQFDPDGWYDKDDPHTWDIDPKEAQHTQRYPKNSTYPLFIFP